MLLETLVQAMLSEKYVSELLSLVSSMILIMHNLPFFCSMIHAFYKALSKGKTKHMILATEL